MRKEIQEEEQRREKVKGHIGNRGGVECSSC